MMWQLKFICLGGYYSLIKLVVNGYLAKIKFLIGYGFTLKSNYWHRVWHWVGSGNIFIDQTMKHRCTQT